MEKSDDTIGRVQYVSVDGTVRTLKKKRENGKPVSKFPFEYTDFGTYILIPILCGTGAGIMLDRFFDIAPLFTLGLIVAGGTLAVYNLFAILNKDGSSRTARSSEG
ncbi:MAG: AtpZ/AtpI family protein [Patescibacteria group bacterium]|nr:AtpZ/AtpI family protein [Patescibacteria group bacterium]